jgi:hypothetical protein
VKRLPVIEVGTLRTKWSMWPDCHGKRRSPTETLRSCFRLMPQALTERQFKVNRPDLWNSRLADARRSAFE